MTDDCDLGVLEALESPAVEFETEDAFLCIECGFDHLKDALFSGAPVAVHADCHGMVRPLPEQHADWLGYSLVIEEVNLCFVIR